MSKRSVCVVCFYYKLDKNQYLVKLTLAAVSLKLFWGLCARLAHQCKGLSEMLIHFSRLKRFILLSSN